MTWKISLLILMGLMIGGFVTFFDSHPHLFWFVLFFLIFSSYFISKEEEPQIKVALILIFILCVFAGVIFGVTNNTIKGISSAYWPMISAGEVMLLSSLLFVWAIYRDGKIKKPS